MTCPLLPSARATASPSIGADGGRTGPPARPATVAAAARGRSWPKSGCAAAAGRAVTVASATSEAAASRPRRVLRGTESPPRKGPAPGGAISGRPRLDVVEAGHRVRLCPEADRAGVVGLVRRLDHELVVEVPAQPAPDRLGAQGLPRPRRDRRSALLDRAAPPAGVLEEDHVVLEGVGAQDVVVVRVLDPEDDPGRLVGSPR